MRPQIPLLIETATVVRGPKDFIFWPIILVLRKVFGRCDAREEDGQQCILQKGHYPADRHVAIIPHGSSFKVFK